MSRHLHRDLEELKNKLLELGAMVERSIQSATQAFLTRDTALARRVIDGDREVDHAEVRIEEECLKILALHQPVAGDLRFVVTALKVDNDLERMGDAAESIAARAVQISALPPFVVPQEFPQMVTMAKGMTRKALECLVQEDASLARQVLEDDLAVDTAQRRMF
jgi:phosphate transport system protein